jgi:transposase
MRSRLEAFVNLLLGQFRQGHRFVRELISVLIPGLKVSQGLISKVKARSARSLDKITQHIMDGILKQEKAIYIDATGWRHQSKNENAIVIRTEKLGPVCSHS